MRCHIDDAARRWGVRSLVTLLFVAGWLGSTGAAWGQIVRIEEDWEMVVGNPDPDTVGPQVTCIISPTGGISGVHANFEINQRTLPNFAAGGLQLQLWYGDYPITQSQSPSSAVMATPNETISWTQSMQLNGGVLAFEISRGSSTTWGSFGGTGNLKVVTVTGLASLSGYNPGVTAAHSSVGYAGNRVKSLVLKRVRAITANGEITEDSTPRVLHSEN